ncbi:hypothetical protein FE257_009933 [Aspergillus nanangensis]|uniref:Uncharacterized protein n=1 Tax=Aspergillus nanangensis TaxID=2582783 RepID=A0AAD4CXU6_ASPNN|nr:hypothetical protein FE257_009933 [Aspergillus nanangensis]
MSRPPHPHVNTIVIDDDDSDEEEDEDMELDYSSGASRQPPIQHPQQEPRYNQPRQPTRPHLPNYTTTIEQEKKVRSRLREERHAALCVLTDRELLTIQALAAQETLPQARRRFLAKLMAPEDPDIAASIRADRFTVQHMSETVQRKVVDVCETGDEGWRRPTTGDGLGSGGAGGSGMMLSSSSPAGRSQRGGGAKGTSSSASLTPEKGRSGNSGGGRARASASRSQQYRERERRRRWSGAERDESGVSFGGFSS